MRRQRLGLALLLAGLMVWVVLRAPPPTADLTQFLPHGATEAQQLLVGELRESPVARLLLARIRLSTPSPGEDDGARLAAASRALAALARQLPAAGSVLNGDQLLSPETTGLLFRYRYLLTDPAHHLDEAALRQALQQRLRELAAPLGPPDRQRLPADPTAALRDYGVGLLGRNGPQRRYGVWFNRAGNGALLLIESRLPAFDLDAQAPFVHTLQQRFQALPEAVGCELTLTGPVPFALESRSRIQGQVGLLSAIASLGVALLLLLLFRSWAVVLLAALPLLAAVVVGMAAVVVAFGAIHGITLAFGITLLGIAVDYPIHLFSHARGRTLEAAAAAIWPTLLLGGITSAIGFSALLLSGFGGLAQLGLFAIAGIGAALAATRWLLPALLPHFATPAITPLGSRWMGARWGGRGVWVALLALLATLYLISRGAGLWEVELAHLSPISAERKAEDGQLRQELGAPDARHLLVITAADQETALERAEQLGPALAALIANGAIAGYQSPAQLLPSRATQRARQAHLPAAEQLAERLQRASAGLPFKAGLFAPFLADVAASRQLPPLTQEVLVGTPLALRLEALLRVREGGALALLPLIGVAQPQALAQLGDGRPWLHRVDLAAASAELVNDYRDEALRLVALGLLVTVLLLWGVLREGRRVVRVVLPPLATVLVTAALLSVGGVRLSLFHLSALLLLIGLGLDYALFFDRPDPPAERAATRGALLICNLSTLLVFGLLAGAAAPVLRAIGLTLAIGAPIGLIFAALVAHNSRPSPETRPDIS